jgi:hypothetical protein
MARLYFKGDDAGKLAGTFYREGKMTGKVALRHMRAVAKLVMEQSVRNSPVDWKGRTSAEPPGQELEKSHRVEEQYRNGRIEATVVVGGMVGAVNVDNYAAWLHDSFGYNLGKASIAKDRASSRNKVGPLFLERALAEYDNEFEHWGGNILDDLVKGLMR